jgi:hypothetical protein
MAGLDPAIHVFAVKPKMKTWMARLNRAMTMEGERLFKEPLRNKEARLSPGLSFACQ